MSDNGSASKKHSEAEKQAGSDRHRRYHAANREQRNAANLARYYAKKAQAKDAGKNQLTKSAKLSAMTRMDEDERKRKRWASDRLRRQREEEERDREAGVRALELLTDPVQSQVYVATRAEVAELEQLLTMPDFVFRVHEDEAEDENLLMEDTSLFDLLEQIDYDLE